MRASIKSLIFELQSLGREDLVTQWNKLQDQPPPPNLSVQLLRAGLAYQLQAQASGSLVKRTRTELKRIVASPGSRRAGRPRGGTQLMREWNGIPHIVDVAERGFLYRGKMYKSLTSIAYEITGAHWSGPRFFGLKTRTTG